jgi:hypothetical protein
MKKILAVFFLLTFGFSQQCAPETGWCFSTSMNQSFFFFYSAVIDGDEIDSGSVAGSGNLIWTCPDADCDIIAAFYNDVCVGWTYPYFGGGYTVPVMMNDGNYPDYPYSGDIVEFRLYDHVTQSIYNTAIQDNPNDGDGITTNIPGVENIEFFLIDLIYDNGIYGNSSNGCTNLSACNFNPDAIYDDGSCEFPEENYDCDGNCIAELDVCGVCGGYNQDLDCNGDINSDGVLNILDIVTLVNVILGD